MKNLLLTLALLSTGVFSFAQEAHKLRIGADFGYAQPSGGDGLLFAIEPKYNVNDNVSVGFRWELAFLTKQLVQGNIAASAGSSAQNSAYLATLDYYLTKEGGNFIPYVGLGMGAYSLGNVRATGAGDGRVASGNKFGGMLRVGFEIKQFRAGVAYNIVPTSTYVGDTGSVKNSYFGFHIGLYIGGGKWDAPRSETEP